MQRRELKLQRVEMRRAMDAYERYVGVALDKTVNAEVQTTGTGPELSGPLGLVLQQLGGSAREILSFGSTGGAPCPNTLR